MNHLNGLRVPNFFYIEFKTLKMYPSIKVGKYIPITVSPIAIDQMNVTNPRTPDEI